MWVSYENDWWSWGIDHMRTPSDYCIGHVLRVHAHQAQHYAQGQGHGHGHH